MERNRTISVGLLSELISVVTHYLTPYSHWPDCNWCRPHGYTNGPKQNDYVSDDSNNDTTSSTLDGSDDPLDDAFLPDFTNQLLEYSVETMAPTEVPHLALRDETVTMPKQTVAFTPSSIQQFPLPSTNGLNAPTSDEAIEADRKPSPTTKSSCTPSPTTSMPPSASMYAVIRKCL